MEVLALSIFELLAGALAMGLLGGLFGAAGMIVVFGMRDRARSRQHRRLDAYAKWLAAQYRLSRAAGSFAAAFRVLANEATSSPYFALRCAEAQRARAEWTAAVRAADHAQAELLTWDDTEFLRQRLASLEPISVRKLRAVVTGQPGADTDLTHHLQTFEAQALSLVQEGAAQPGRRGRR